MKESLVELSVLIVSSLNMGSATTVFTNPCSLLEVMTSEFA